MQREFIVGGRRIEAVWHGPAPDKAPTLILLHEGLGCVAMWRDFPAKLAERTGYGVLAYSRPGYGKSDPVPLPRPLTYMHDEGLEILPAILNLAKVENAILVGHSDGASIATIYAGGRDDQTSSPLPRGEGGARSAPGEGVGTHLDQNPLTPTLSPTGRGRHKQHAPRLRGLVLMAPHFFCEDLSVTSIAAAKEAYETTDLRARLARYHGENVDIAFWGWNKAWLHPDFRRWNITEFLPTVSAPMLIIQGREDQYGTAAQIEAARAEARVPVEVLYLDDCRHAPQADQPDATLAAISDFCRQTFAGDGEDAASATGTRKGQHAF